MSDQIGPYLIISEVGSGGMGVVHLARDTVLNVGKGQAEQGASQLIG
jgi:hypothetical protein